MACYALAFLPVFWVVARFLPPGWGRDAVGTIIWYLVSTVLSELVWKPLSQGIDRVLD